MTMNFGRRDSGFGRHDFKPLEMTFGRLDRKPFQSLKIAWIFHEEYLKVSILSRYSNKFILFWSVTLTVCPREVQAGVKHVITPISFKLLQFMSH